MRQREDAQDRHESDGSLISDKTNNGPVAPQINIEQSAVASAMTLNAKIKHHIGASISTKSPSTGNDVARISRGNEAQR